MDEVMPLIDAFDELVQAAPFVEIARVIREPELASRRLAISTGSRAEHWDMIRM